MKLMIVCSTTFYNRIEPIKEELERKGHILLLPNSYDGVTTEHNYDSMSEEEYAAYFKKMYNLSRNKISTVDGILVLNYTKTKNGEDLVDYVGASTFLEMYEAFMNGKKIYMLNDIPNNILYDEIKGFSPIILNGDFDIIK